MRRLVVLAAFALVSTAYAGLEDWSFPGAARYYQHYDAAVAALAEGGNYNPAETLDGGITPAFIHCSSHWDVFIPLLQQRLTAVSQGRAVLEPMSEEEAGAGIQGQAAYFRLTRQTDRGPDTSNVVLMQNGIRVWYPKPPLGPLRVLSTKNTAAAVAPAPRAPQPVTRLRAGNYRSDDGSLLIRVTEAFSGGDFMEVEGRTADHRQHFRFEMSLASGEARRSLGRTLNFVTRSVTRVGNTVTYVLQQGSRMEAHDMGVTLSVDALTGDITGIEVSSSTARFSLPNGLHSGPIRQTLTAVKCDRLLRSR
jgi:hypothetical protein